MFVFFTSFSGGGVDPPPWYGTYPLKKIQHFLRPSLIIRSIRIRQYHEFLRIAVLFALFLLEWFTKNKKLSQYSHVTCPKYSYFSWILWRRLYVSRNNGSRCCIILLIREGVNERHFRYNNRVIFITKYIVNCKIVICQNHIF